ncbi:hypothetical protein L593_14440 [Salinarchaeum sp. Harcht-Bsk1]|nr:hypothetical protein L593_14440 [Salinarchaeum sp. Harcht-Bsk1]
MKSDGIRLDHAAHHTQTPIYGTEADRETGFPDSMNLREHDNRDDMKVWLSQADVAQLLDRADCPNSVLRSRSVRAVGSAPTRSLT